MHPRLQRPLAVASVLMLAATHPVNAQSLRVPVDLFGSATWTARVEIDPRPRFTLNRLFIAQQASSQNLALFGDYQFSDWRLGSGGGLRLTSGIIFSARTLTVSYLDNEVGTASPYAGIGYSAGNANTPWGWSADIGFTANGTGALRLDRLLSGGTNLSTDANWRLLPQIRLGMRLQF